MGKHEKVDFKKLHEEEMRRPGGPRINPVSGKPGYEGLEHNFEVYEETSDDGLRKTFSRGNALTPKGHQIRADEAAAYDAVFGDHSGPEQSDREPNKGLKRVLFGKWT